ncbi:MAG: 1,4-dihydroxy-2-naphthoate octaprenyltransferase [Dehalococcoidia bacterium]
MRIWLRAVRPRSLTASIVPVLIGTLLAAREVFRPAAFLAALIASMAIQIGTNLANDYYDYRQGLDASRSLRPDMTIQTGELRADALLRGAAAAFALALLLGLFLIWQAGLPVLWLGCAGAFAGYAYTANPFKLGYRALGELLVFVFMGPVIVEGAYYVQTHHWSVTAVLAALPIALLVTAILHANNLRDMDDDLHSGKRTLANVFGRRFAVFELRLLVLGAYPVLIALLLTRIVTWGAVLSLLTLCSAWRIARQAEQECELSAQNRLLAGTARLHFHFGLLLSLGILIGRLL